VALVGLIALGLALAAAQLVPTAELTQSSIRSGGLTVEDASSFSLPPSLIWQAIAPNLGDLPQSEEWIGYVGVSGLLLAAIGLVRRPRREAVWLAVVALVGL